MRVLVATIRLVWTDHGFHVVETAQAYQTPYNALGRYTRYLCLLSKYSAVEAE